MNTSPIRSQTVRSSDGTVIHYRMLGNGPGLLIIHGAFRASQHYMHLAHHLSEHYTVYVMDRRGRNGSGPKGEDYTFQKECEDAKAMIQKHSIRFLFGHSLGALISLQTGLQVSLQKIALYEPPLMQYMTFDWLPQMEKELREQQPVAASVTFLKGMQMGGFLGKWPKPVLKLIFRFMAKGKEWEENVALLYTVPEEIHALLNKREETQTYKYISNPTLLMVGTRTTEYLKQSAKAIEAALPDVQSLQLEGFDHNTPDEKEPKPIADILHTFFASKEEQ